ncbi:hypothetical protein Acr_07g0015130 [Actinidia rufa]|uniref:Uncharacterized protein n=1 Tax=Actinidia rufa TaxID=165716 RepID=A0A7J0F0A6_9ERIC|nr:hypothetical protein Acr_07g0015130 [Actinidia rufa]
MIQRLGPILGDPMYLASKPHLSINPIWTHDVALRPHHSRTPSLSPPPPILPKRLGKFLELDLHEGRNFSDCRSHSSLSHERDHCVVLPLDPELLGHVACMSLVFGAPVRRLWFKWEPIKPHFRV